MKKSRTRVSSAKTLKVSFSCQRRTIIVSATVTLSEKTLKFLGI